MFVEVSGDCRAFTHKKSPRFAARASSKNQVSNRLVQELEQTCCAHTAADTHGDDTIFRFAALAFQQD